jgi:enoyl-[acyl-carrier-protein] reductase (NADH)
MIPTFKAKLGIANEHSIAWGCAAAFRALGAEHEFVQQVVA